MSSPGLRIGATRAACALASSALLLLPGLGACGDGGANEARTACTAGTHEEDGACVPDAVAASCASADPCGNHGSCRDAASGPTCACDPGYRGDLCDACAAGYHLDGTACVADPTCATTNPCGVFGTCSDGATGPACDCDEGFMGAHCDACEPGFVPDVEDGCVPASACATADPCGTHGQCSDGAAGPTCACATGYAGATCDGCDDGFHMTEAGCVANVLCAAADPCGTHGDCSDGPSGPLCACDSGYAGPTCGDCDAGYHAETGACVADITCLPTSCGGHGACSIIEGAVSCACDPRYTGAACASCADGFQRNEADGPCVPAECDTTSQDCGADDTKCTIIASDPASPTTGFETECLAAGTVGESEACVRTPLTGNAGVGHDDCDVGLYCSGVALPPTSPPTRACRRLCTSTTDCTVADQACLTFDGGGPIEGFCIPTCRVGIPDACDAGLSCGVYGENSGGPSFGTCRLLGAAARGEPCQFQESCQADMTCVTTDGANFTCQPLCDLALGCASPSDICAAQAWTPAGAGLCVPNPCPDDGPFCDGLCCGPEDTCEQGRCVPPPKCADGSSCVADPVLSGSCPPACTGGCPAGVCVIACNGISNCQNATLTCPDDLPCRVSCGGISSCQGATIQCPMGASCELACTEISACQGSLVVCGDGRCKTTCTGMSASVGYVMGDDACGCELGCQETYGCVEGIDCPGDGCFGAPCGAHGACHASGPDYTCACDDGYGFDGTTCAWIPTPCDGVTCSGVGTCSVVGGAPACACQNGFTAVGTSCHPNACPADPTPASCPAACTGGCVDGFCVIACDGTSECSSQTITCPADMACRVACSGVSACQGADVVCPTSASCELACTNTSACQGADVQCGSGACMSTCTGLSTGVGTMPCGSSCGCVKGCGG